VVGFHLNPNSPEIRKKSQLTDSQVPTQQRRTWRAQRRLPRPRSSCCCSSAASPPAPGRLPPPMRSGELPHAPPPAAASAMSFCCRRATRAPSTPYVHLVRWLFLISSPFLVHLQPRLIVCYLNGSLIGNILFAQQQGSSACGCVAAGLLCSLRIKRIVLLSSAPANQSGTERE
jgi:hypothetical protein